MVMVRESQEIKPDQLTTSCWKTHLNLTQQAENNYIIFISQKSHNIHYKNINKINKVLEILLYK